MKRDLNLFLSDILENIRLIEKSLMNISKPDFESNRDIIDATVRRLEVIGEAVKNLPNSFREKYPKVSWKEIAGIRDRVIHHYFGLDLNLIWDIVHKDIPKLKKDVLNIIEMEKIK